ncbi:MAG: hypothetical protein ACYSUD_02340 [Planctomycetota bacterium]|jgi:hypothetical protein
MSDISSADFEKWACSLSGCDGGHPKADTWLCGIEWGGDNTEKYYQVDLPAEIAAGDYEPESKYVWADHQEYNFGKNVAKLYAAYQGKDVRQYEKHLHEFGDDSLFKLNLYPIAFRHTGGNLWHDNQLDKITGFEDKELYRIWCFLNRFPKYSERVKDYEPKLIIGLGVSYLADFFACFAGATGRAAQIHVETIEPAAATNSSTRRFYWAKIGPKTTLAVVPFFSGSHGLNSYYLLGEVGKRLRKIVDETN